MTAENWNIYLLGIRVMKGMGDGAGDLNSNYNSVFISHVDNFSEAFCASFSLLVKWK